MQSSATGCDIGGGTEGNIPFLQSNNGDVHLIQQEKKERGTDKREIVQERLQNHTKWSSFNNSELALRGRNQTIVIERNIKITKGGCAG